MKNKISFQVWDEFSEDLEKDWNDLFLMSNNSFFQSYNWQSLWFNELIKKDLKRSIMIVGVYNDGKVVAIFPFENLKILNLNIIRLTGFPFADYLDCLIDKNFLTLNSNLKNNLFQFLKNQKKVDVIQLSNLTPNSNFCKFLKDTNFNKSSFKAYQITGKENQTPISNKKFVLDTKRQIKRLNSLGNLSFKIVKNEIEKKRIIKFFFDNKEKQLIKTKNWNYLENKNYRYFLEKLFIQNYCDISYLSLNEEIIAVHLGFIYNDKMFYIFPTYNNEYSNYSPGNILLYNLVNIFFDNGGKVFDFTIGNEGYKMKLSNRVVDICHKDLSLTFYGNLLVPFLFSINFLKKIKIINYLFRLVRY